MPPFFGWAIPSILSPMYKKKNHRFLEIRHTPCPLFRGEFREQTDFPPNKKHYATYFLMGDSKYFITKVQEEKSPLFRNWTHPLPLFLEGNLESKLTSLLIRRDRGRCKPVRFKTQNIILYRPQDILHIFQNLMVRKPKHMDTQLI